MDLGNDLTFMLKTFEELGMKVFFYSIKLHILANFDKGLLLTKEEVSIICKLTEQLCSNML